MSIQRVLVNGCTGFIGSAVVCRFYEISVLKY